MHLGQNRIKKWTGMATWKPMESSLKSYSFTTRLSLNLSHSATKAAFSRVRQPLVRVGKGLLRIGGRLDKRDALAHFSLGDFWILCG